MKASRRIVVLLLALLLILTYFPVGVFAVVDHVEFDFRDPAGDNYPDLTGREDISWNEDTNTLTLTDFDLGEMRSAFLLPADSTIVLAGENIIYASLSTDMTIWAEGSLALTGDGSLSIQEPFIGIVAEGDLTLSDTEIVMEGFDPSTLTIDVELSSRLPVSFMGLYSEYGRVVVDGTDLLADDFFFGINAGLFGGIKSLDGMAPQERGVSIINSNVSLTLDQAEFETFAIASADDDVDVVDSNVVVEGYPSAIISGARSVGILSAEIPFTTIKGILPSGNIEVTGSTLDLTGSSMSDSYPGYGLLASQGDINVTDSDLSMTDFVVGMSGGFEVRPTYRASDEPVLDTQNITIDKSRVEIVGVGCNDELDYGMSSLGMITANGNITLMEVSAVIDDVYSGIAAGVQGTGEVLFDTSNVTLGVVGGRSAMIQAIIGTVSAPMMFSEVEPDHVLLQDCYIKVPADGSVERYEEELDLKMHLAELLIFDYIEANLEGEVVISTFPVVSFDSNGGEAVESQTVLPSEKAEEPAVLDRFGYTFHGWFIDDGTFENKWDFETDAVTDDMILYAKWTRNPQQVSFVEEDETSGVGATGIEENVNLPETEDESIVDIKVFVTAKEINVQDSLKEKVLTELAGKGYEMLVVYDIGLFKRVTDLEGVTTESAVGNEDITGEITVYIPLTPEQVAKEKLAMAFIDDAGEMTIIEGRVVTIAEDAYFVFSTDHFSTYALVEMTREANPATGYGNDMDPSAVSLGALPYVGMAFLGIVVILWKRKRAF